MNNALATLMEQILNGLTLGSLYALVTLGLVLTFSVFNVVNFAHGDLFMVSGYTLYLLLNFTKFPYWFIVILVIVLTGVYSVIMERLTISPILDKGFRAYIIATLGLSIIIQNAVVYFFTTDPRHVPTVYTSQIVTLLGMRASVQRWIVLVVTVLVFIALQWFVRYTKLGKTMRAVSQNQMVSKLLGIDTHRISIITFAIGGAITGLAAALVSPLFNVYPYMGAMLTLKALAAIIMGGMGQVNGAIYASFIIGMIESLFGGYVSLAYKDVAAFVFFIVVLFLRPNGLFGKRIGL
jgi:branched-chain amino acid transport system permease protein